MIEASIVLCALYLRGLERQVSPPRRGWMQVERALRRAGLSDLSLAEDVLRSAGLDYEALALAEPSLLSRAERLLTCGRALTATCDGYPSRWFQLGTAAPPALWLGGCDWEGVQSNSVAPRLGSNPFASAGSWITIVGSRLLTPRERHFAIEAGREAARLGLVVISGGAVGADQAALRAASHAGGSTVTILPSGLEVAPRHAGPVLSVCAPRETFSTGTAMERNLLLYAASPTSIVVACRFREGGSWHGATEALRRRLTAIWVFPQEGSPRHEGPRGLLALGARALADPRQLETALLAGPPQASLPFLLDGLSAPTTSYF